MSRAAAGLDHVAIAVSRLADVAEFVVGELGGRPAAGGPGPGYTGAQWWLGEARLEVLEPAGAPGGFLHRFLERHGAGIHHVTFVTPDLAAAVGRARDLGYDIVGLDDTKPWWKEAFLHPKQAHGIVVQLAEANPELGGEEGSWSDDFPFPTSSRPPPEGASLSRVVLSVRDAAAARLQWQELLGGELEQEGALLVYRWPRSPLGIGVEIDPEREEGPLKLELFADRALDLPRGSHPILGTRFVQVARAR
jgi:methylmalonyl-CoA/ethylmalonyl-CoA epimerase